MSPWAVMVSFDAGGEARFVGRPAARLGQRRSLSRHTRLIDERTLGYKRAARLFIRHGSLFLPREGGWTGGCYVIAKNQINNRRVFHGEGADWDQFTHEPPELI